MHAIANEKQTYRRSAITAGSIGFEIILYICIGFLGAPWLAHRWGLGSWFKVLGAVVGIGCSINALVRIARDYNKDLKRDESSDKPRP